MILWEGTWAAIEATLHTAGIDSATVEAVRKATAEFRHEGRKHAAYWAARRWLSHALDFRKDYGLLDVYAYALCFAESIGLYGGSPRDPGAGTTRHPAFRGLGKGRRHASDGPAWTAAIAAVAAEASADVTVDPDGRLVVYVRKDRAEYFVPVCVLLAHEPEARRNFAIYAAKRGWDARWPELIIAAAKELDAASKETEAEAYEAVAVVAQETETEDDFWVEVAEEE